jgi:ketosteroid isomerase-like protein
VLVLTRYSGAAKSSGLTVDQEGAHVWQMRDGTAQRLEVFPDRHAALRALGLEGLPDG